MEDLIPTVNRLQNVFAAVGQNGIDLPQIVVIGTQSSGKSSVLEALVGRDFLPRGSGIVTRRPLVLQLISTLNRNSGSKSNDEDVKRDDSSDNLEWGEFLHIPNRKFSDFNEILTEISRETERLLGGGNKSKSVSDIPITLKIFSPKVLTLSLVDLPGITRVAIADQPRDIELQIRNMCLKYISNPQSIILAVTAANTDLGTSDALQMSREVDPHGTRTIGVLTKLDLMDPGTNAADMLQGRIIPLERGYIGVVCRGQKDIDCRMAVGDGIDKEREFFASRPEYHTISLRTKCGTEVLAKSLNHMLINHIRECLPDVRAKITNMVVAVQSEIDSLGLEPPDTNSRAAMGSTLLSIISSFVNNFQLKIDAKQGNRNNSHISVAFGADQTGSSSLSSGELEGGARIAFIFNRLFCHQVNEIRALEGMTDEDVRMAIANANGTRQSLFVPDIAFDFIVISQMSRLEPAGMRCSELVFDELQRIAGQCVTESMRRFPRLRDKIMEETSHVISSYMTPCQQMLSQLICIEQSFINTAHPDFIGGSQAVAQLVKRHVDDDGSRAGDDDGTSGKMRQQTQGISGGGASLTTSAVKKPPVSSSSSSTPHTPQSSSSSTSTTPTQQQQQSATTWLGSIFGSSIISSSSSSKGNSSGHGGLLTQTLTGAYLPAMTDREQLETEIIKSLVTSYFNVVRKTWVDLVPKTIMCLLVGKTISNLQNELVSNLYRDELLGSLLQESDDVASKRTSCKQTQTLLRKALEIVNQVRDFNNNNSV